MEIQETQERKMNKKQRKEERTYTLFRTLPINYIDIQYIGKCHMPKTFSNQHITQKSKRLNIIRNIQLVIFFIMKIRAIKQRMAPKVFPICPIYLILSQNTFKTCWDLRAKLHRLMGYGVIKTKNISVQAQTLQRVVAITIFCIATHRVIYISSVDAYLIFAPCLQLKLYQRMRIGGS